MTTRDEPILRDARGKRVGLVPFSPVLGWTSTDQPAGIAFAVACAGFLLLILTGWLVGAFLGVVGVLVCVALVLTGERRRIRYERYQEALASIERLEAENAALDAFISGPAADAPKVATPRPTPQPRVTVASPETLAQARRLLDDAQQLSLAGIFELAAERIECALALLEPHTTDAKTCETVRERLRVARSLTDRLALGHALAECLTLLWTAEHGARS